MKSVYVFGTRVKITRVKGLIQDHGARGLYYFDEKRIEIDSSLKGEEYQATLFHELIHAVWDITGLNQTSVPIDVQEIIAENFSRFLSKSFKFTKK